MRREEFVEESPRQIWRRKPGDRVVRHPRQEELAPLRLRDTTRRVPPRTFASPLVLVYTFGGLVAVGTALLMLPVASRPAGAAPFLTALFTATSAVTVTGLVVEDTAAYWTRTGQVIIMALIFVGGLGFMTTATFLLVLIGHRVSLVQRLMVRETLGVDRLGGLVRMTVGIVVMAVVVQLATFGALLARFYGQFPAPEAVWQAAFQAVSAFNNAGFVTLPQGLAPFQRDVAVLMTLAVSVILGGVSYLVLTDLLRVRRFSRLTLNSKLVLTMSAALLVLGTAVFLVFEYDNPRTLGSAPLGHKVLLSFFHSVSSRTAGFAAVDFGATKPPSNFFYASLMFIGGASASVAGGIKVNTFAVIVVAVVSFLRGRSYASIFGREIPDAQVRRAMVVGAVASAFIFGVVFLLSVAEPEMSPMDLLFESVSAFGTVGLSTGLTPELSMAGRLLVVATMFIGRIGPLSVGLAMAGRREGDHYRYARERVTIG